MYAIQKKILRGVNFVRIIKNIFQRWSSILATLAWFLCNIHATPRGAHGRYKKKNRCRNEIPVKITKKYKKKNRRAINLQKVWGEWYQGMQKHINMNKFADLSQDWVGDKMLFMCFLVVIPHGGENTHKQNPPPPRKKKNSRTIPWALCLCFFFVFLLLPNYDV